MDRLEILVEERSMEELLIEILPKILPTKWKYQQNYFIRSHNGKSDLQRSIPIKVKTFSHFSQQTAIVILQDQDANNCKQLKEKLINLCANSCNSPCTYLIRIVCHELEAWYFGSPDAIEKVFPHQFKANQYKHKNICKNPDAIVNPKSRLKHIVGDYSQIQTSRIISKDFDVENNTSVSFNKFKEGLLRIANL